MDAVSLDVVTQSRFTINIYGYCGTSSLQEFANGDLKGLLPKLEPIEKLRYAAWVAQGVADVHGVDWEEEDKHGESRNLDKDGPMGEAVGEENLSAMSKSGNVVPLIHKWVFCLFRALYYLNENSLVEILTFPFI